MGKRFKRSSHGELCLASYSFSVQLFRSLHFKGKLPQISKSATSKCHRNLVACCRACCKTTWGCEYKFLLWVDKQITHLRGRRLYSRHSRKAFSSEYRWNHCRTNTKKFAFYLLHLCYTQAVDQLKIPRALRGYRICICIQSTIHKNSLWISTSVDICFISADIHGFAGLYRFPWPAYNLSASILLLPQLQKGAAEYSLMISNDLYPKQPSEYIANLFLFGL